MDWMVSYDSMLDAYTSRGGISLATLSAYEKSATSTQSCTTIHCYRQISGIGNLTIHYFLSLGSFSIIASQYFTHVCICCSKEANIWSVVEQVSIYEVIYLKYLYYCC